MCLGVRTWRRVWEIDEKLDITNEVRQTELYPDIEINMQPTYLRKQTVAEISGLNSPSLTTLAGKAA